MPFLSHYNKGICYQNDITTDIDLDYLAKVVLIRSSVKDNKNIYSCATCQEHSLYLKQIMTTMLILDSERLCRHGINKSYLKLTK